VPGHHVHHGEESAAAVDRSGGPAHDLDALDEVEVDDELLAHVGLLVDVVVGAQAVEQQEDSGAVIPRPVEAAHPDVGVAAVLGHVEAGQGAQHIRERPVAVLANLRRGHDAHRGRRLAQGLDTPGRGVHDLGPEQIVEAHASQVGRIRRGGCPAPGISGAADNQGQSDRPAPSGHSAGTRGPIPDRGVTRQMAWPTLEPASRCVHVLPLISPSSRCPPHCRAQPSPVHDASPALSAT
jgi:hypothetical protein